jgi:hypothetical protein
MRQDEVKISGGFHSARPIIVRCRPMADALRRVDLAISSMRDMVVDYLSERQMRIVDRHICGHPGCTCGGMSRSTAEAAE